MDGLFGIALIALFVVVGLGLLIRGKGSAPFEPPATKAADPAIFQMYQARDSLLVNGSERAMWRALDAAMPTTHRLMAKVRLEDILQVRPGTDAKTRWSLRSRIKSRHVDFLITDDWGVPRIAVELDGSSHNASAKAADDLKDGLFQACGLPLVRVRVGQDFAAQARAVMAKL